ncbi:uncharacterized protein LOC143452756 isoform X1 [Clavelina lepadiformis]|uniref:uncharacterized protein LOC143452756 isoform X1 n=1 Tax=Clavelina lepadiformis TaxID=159417 RepID=UPI0040435886
MTTSAANTMDTSFIVNEEEGIVVAAVESAPITNPPTSNVPKSEEDDVDEVPETTPFSNPTTSTAADIQEAENEAAVVPADDTSDSNANQNRRNCCNRISRILFVSKKTSWMMFGVKLVLHLAVVYTILTVFLFRYLRLEL